MVPKLKITKSSLGLERYRCCYACKMQGQKYNDFGDCPPIRLKSPLSLVANIIKISAMDEVDLNLPKYVVTLFSPFPPLQAFSSPPARPPVLLLEPGAARAPAAGAEELLVVHRGVGKVNSTDFPNEIRINYFFLLLKNQATRGERDAL